MNSLFQNVQGLINKTDSSQRHFGFTNHGSEMLIYSVRAKRNFKLWFGSPCNKLLKQLLSMTVFLIVCIIVYTSINKLATLSIVFLTKYFTYGIELLTSSALLSTVLACELVTLQRHSWFKYKIKSPGLSRPSLATQLSGSICRTTVPHSSKARASNWIPVREKKC